MKAMSAVAPGSTMTAMSGGTGVSRPTRPLAGSMQVCSQNDALSRSQRFAPSSGFKPAARVASTAHTPQPPSQTAVLPVTRDTTPIVTRSQPAWNRDQATQRALSPRVVPPSTTTSGASAAMPPGKLLSGTTVDGQRAVSPRTRHFAWPTSTPKKPSTPVKAMAPLSPSCTRREEAERRPATTAFPGVLAPKVLSSENAPVSQARGKNIPTPGKATHSPFQQREALRERNVPSPIVMQKPLGAAFERIALEKPRHPEPHDLGEENTVEAATMEWAIQATPVKDAPSAPQAIASTPQPPVVFEEAPQFSRPQPPVAFEEVPQLSRGVVQEVCECPPSLLFSMLHAHPMVTPEEKTFLMGCLQAFSDIVQQEGGFQEYAFKTDCPAKDELVGTPEEDEPPATPLEVLRRSSETMLRNTVRNGTDSVQVLLGGVMSMGMKKVVKIEIKCEEMAMQEVMSVFWDWDVRLEQKSGETPRDS